MFCISPIQFACLPYQNRKEQKNMIKAHDAKKKTHKLRGNFMFLMKRIISIPIENRQNEFLKYLGEFVVE